MTIENLAQSEVVSSSGRSHDDVTLAYTQWTQSFLTVTNEEYDMEMAALYTSVDFNMTGVFYDGDKFEGYLAYEDPENPGMTIGATCQIKYQEERFHGGVPYVPHEEVSVINYYADETQEFKVDVRNAGDMPG